MAVLDAALAELGVKRMLLAIHDVSFPADAAEDLGRGAPTTAAAARLLGYARGLGFTGIQLGPQGQTSRANPSPYDSTIFSRHTGTIALGAFRADGPFAGLVDDAQLAQAPLATPGGRAQHRRAYDVTAVLVTAAHASLRAGARPDLAAGVAAFRAEHAAWLARDALFAALCAAHGDRAVREWPAAERTLWQAPDPAPRDALMARHADAIERYAVGQYLAHQQHAQLRATAGRAGLALYGDLQVGYAESDAWAYAAAFLADYVMGAPPSRTNPEGQPWNYPVLDPAQVTGAAGALVVARVDKMLAEYDSLRIDHPHGLVCPWVYRAGTDDPALAVRMGARLFESPDLPDHPALAQYAIARADQLDRGVPRYADGWLTDLEPAQIDRYAVLFDAIAAAAARHGRASADLSCEVLSTMPLPLEAMLARFGLGRWRITQKANLADPRDVYRADAAARPDWVMLGNHDTAPLFGLLATWPAERREAWARHLAARLALARPERLAEPRFFASAMLAELFLSRAENVSIFFADLFGITERFNEPGLVSDENWSLRLPADFDRLHADRLARGAALDIPLAAALALAARGSTSAAAVALQDHHAERR